MSQTMTVSDELYSRLQAEASLRGVSIESLLEEWEQKESELAQRRGVVQHIKELHKQMSAKYGEMLDSTELVREDRER